MPEYLNACMTVWSMHDPLTQQPTEPKINNEKQKPKPKSKPNDDNAQSKQAQQHNNTTT